MNRHISFIVFVAILYSSGFKREVCAQTPESRSLETRPTAVTDKERLQGTWICVSYETKGEKDPSALGYLLIVEGNTIKSRADDGSEISATYKLAATKNPKQLIWTYPPETPDGKSEVLHEIYKFDRGRLVTSGGHPGDPAPTVFFTTKDDRLGVSIYQRK